MNKLGLFSIGFALLLLSVWLVWPSGNDAVIADLSPKPSSASGLTIIAFGDSLTAGYGVATNETYPAQLETALRLLGHEVKVINAGVSGETTRGNLERASFIREQNPDIVLLGIGGNDALRLLPLTETKKNIRETVALLQGGDNPPVVVLLRMQAPLTAGLSYKQDFDALYEEVAEEYGLVLVPFLTMELFLDPQNKLPDGIHYNAKGYERVVNEYILPVLETVIEKLKE